MNVGCVPIADGDPETANRLNALRQAGCLHIFTDPIDSTRKDMPGLEAAMTYMQEGDILIVDSLQSLGRSLTHLVVVVNQLGNRGYGFRSLQEEIDTTVANKGCVSNVFAALAEFEKVSARRRTQAGLTAARARGRQDGWPKGLSEKAQRTAILTEELYLAGNLSVMEICRELSISKPTLYQYLRHRGVTIGVARITKGGGITER